MLTAKYFEQKKKNENLEAKQNDLMKKNENLQNEIELLKLQLDKFNKEPNE